MALPRLASQKALTAPVQRLVIWAAKSPKQISKSYCFVFRLVLEIVTHAFVSGWFVNDLYGRRFFARIRPKCQRFRLVAIERCLKFRE